ncbi:MAG: glutamine synthetase [Devosiaceae bacterium]|nr:glutamine synthetase [Devosiaceae bacterium MH13]
MQSIEVFLTDPNAVLRGKWLPGSDLAKLESGVAFPYSLLGCDVWGREVHETGLHITSGDKDALCQPVPGRTVRVPWAQHETVQAMLSMRHGDGAPFFGDPRNVLERMVERLAERGVTASAALELEFYIYERCANTGRPHPAGTLAAGPEGQHMYALDDLDRRRPLLEAITQASAAQDLPIDATVSEAAPGQYEINLKHRDPLGAADDAVMLKRLITQVADGLGTPVTFMAKPFADQPGNGMHVHASLRGPGGEPIFADPVQGPARLKHAVQGLLSTMEEAQLGFVHSFNGFRRMQVGSYAPASLSWGENNRSVAVRLPEAMPAARRVEHRLAGADANPYIVTALVLAGMLKGLDEAAEPPPASTGNAYDDAALTRLTPSMDEALRRFETSAFIADALTEEFVRIYCAIKRAELAAFAGHISALEHRTFL